MPKTLKELPSYQTLCRSWQRFADEYGGTFCETRDREIGFGHPKARPQRTKRSDVSEQSQEFMDDPHGQRAAIATVTLPYKRWLIVYQPLCPFLGDYLIRVSVELHATDDFLYSFVRDKGFFRTLELAIGSPVRSIAKIFSVHENNGKPDTSVMRKTGNKLLDSRYVIAISDNLKNMACDPTIIDSILRLDRIWLFWAVANKTHDLPSSACIMQSVTAIDTAQLADSLRFMKLLLDSLDNHAVLYGAQR